MENELTVSQNRTERIAWIDIYKALAIVLVVLGHATARFNPWIYQFHMAAFFFISGYTVNYNKRGLARTFWDRFFSLLLPFFTAYALLLGLEVVLQYVGLRQLVFGNFPYLGVSKSVEKLFSKGENYAWFSSAGWFVVALFGIDVLGKFLDDILRKNKFLYFVLSAVFFVFGRWMVDQHYKFHISIFFVNTIFIGHFYFALGHLARNSVLLKRAREKIPILGKAACLLLTVCMLQFFKKFGFVVDFTSETFNHNLWFEAFAAVNGCAFLFFVSILLEKVNVLKKTLLLLGANTLGVVFFHFLFFKPTQLLLIFIKKTDIALLSEFVPKSLGGYSWPLFVVVSIVLSVGLWGLLLKISFFRVLFGKTPKLYDKWRGFARRAFEAVFGVETKNLSLAVWSDNTSRYLQQSKAWILPFVFSVLVAIPMLTQGVMCNDELQINTWIEGGFATSFDHWYADELLKGRTLAAFVFALTNTCVELLGGERSPLNRIVPMLLHFICVLLFFKFIKRMTNKSTFAKFCAVFLLAFTPLLFEHTMPNAFNFYLLCFIMLLTSLILFYDYQNLQKKQMLFWSMVLFFASCCSYELFVTYVFIYLFIIIKTKKTRLFQKQTIQAFIPPAATGFLYVVAYCACRVFFPSGYAGNKIGFSARGAVKVVLGMFRAAVPGYFSFDPKYKYLAALYSNNLRPIDSIRIIVVVLLFAMIVYGFVKKLASAAFEKKTLRAFFIPLCCSILYVLLPSFPNSLGQMYQNDFNAGNWWPALPVSYFLFYASAFASCWCVWHFVRLFRNKTCAAILPAVVALALSLYLLPVQRLNSIVSNQQYKDWERICDIHDFLDTNYVRKIGAAKVYAPDFFETRNLLAIDAQHYSLYQSFKGGQLELVNEKPVESLSEDEWFISMPNDKYFVIAGHGNVVVACKGSLPGKILVPRPDGSWQHCSFVRQWPDKSFVFYETDVSYGAELEAIGKTLKRALVVKGFHYDGWLKKESEFNLKTGDEGRVDFAFYYPYDDFDGKNVTIFVNGQKTLVSIDNDFVKCSAPAPANEVVDIKIECSWEIPVEKKNGDTRELSILLTEMNGK